MSYKLLVNQTYSHILFFLNNDALIKSRLFLRIMSVLFLSSFMLPVYAIPIGIYPLVSNLTFNQVGDTKTLEVVLENNAQNPDTFNFATAGVNNATATFVVSNITANSTSNIPLCRSRMTLNPSDTCALFFTIKLQTTTNQHATGILFFNIFSDSGQWINTAVFMDTAFSSS